MIQRWIVTSGIASTLHSPGSPFNVELWPRVISPHWILTRVLIPRCIVTPSHDSTMNCDPWPGSQFHVNSDAGSELSVEFWPGVAIQHGIMTHLHTCILYPWNCNSRRCQNYNVLKIQQLRWLIIQQKSIECWPGSVFHWGRDSKFYLTQAVPSTSMIENPSHI